MGRSGILLPSNQTCCDDGWKPPCPHWVPTRSCRTSPPYLTEAAFGIGSLSSSFRPDRRLLKRKCAGRCEFEGGFLGLISSDYFASDHSVVGSPLEQTVGLPGAEMLPYEKMPAINCWTLSVRMSI